MKQNRGGCDPRDRDRSWQRYLARHLPGRVAWKHTAWANAKNFAGAADPNESVGFRVYLGWKSAAGAEALARAVSDPKSPRIGQYLTPAQFRRQFAPSQSQVGAVQSGSGARVSRSSTPANNHYVAAEGTVAQAQAALATLRDVQRPAARACARPSADVPFPARWQASSTA